MRSIILTSRSSHWTGATWSRLVLAIWLVLSPNLQLRAKDFKTLHCFQNYYAEGSNPYAGLVLSNNVLYGTTRHEGRFRAGVVFGINVDGTGFTNLHDFGGFPTEGGLPVSELIMVDNVLYGTSAEGTNGSGTIFSVNVDGSDFQTLHTFSGFPDGASPLGLVSAGDTLFGVAGQGGGSYGTVFKINVDGGGFTNLHVFSDLQWTNGSNGDGANPFGRLVLSENILYGTASRGGDAGNGTVFALDTDGSGFRTLHSFSATSSTSPYTNSDGATPEAGLVLSGGQLYGVAMEGGLSGYGTVFALNTDGSGFTTLHSFSEPIGGGPYYTNYDGIAPRSELALSGTTLYGTAAGGGDAGVGTIFSVNTDGTGFQVLHTFDTDGALPLGGLLLTDCALFGTTAFGGCAHGTVFSISYFPQLTIVLSDSNVRLVWPNAEAGFDYSAYALESTTNLTLSAWNSVSPPPDTVDGTNTVTVPISGVRQFYRLRR